MGAELIRQVPPGRCAIHVGSRCSISGSKHRFNTQLPASPTGQLPLCPGRWCAPENRVCIDPVLGSRVQTRQTGARVYIADRQLGTDNEPKHGYADYEEPAHHFCGRTLTTERLTSQATAEIAHCNTTIGYRVRPQVQRSFATSFAKPLWRRATEPRREVARRRYRMSLPVSRSVTGTHICKQNTRNMSATRPSIVRVPRTDNCVAYNRAPAAMIHQCCHGYLRFSQIVAFPNVRLPCRD
jgi:hypothetical protein